MRWGLEPKKLIFGKKKFLDFPADQFFFFQNFSWKNFWCLSLPGNGTRNWKKRRSPDLKKPWLYYMHIFITITDGTWYRRKVHALDSALYFVLKLYTSTGSSCTFYTCMYTWHTYIIHTCTHECTCNYTFIRTFVYYV